MPNKNKRLGSALENQVVKMARERGLKKAKKQPYSGQTKEDPGDVVLTSQILAECKARAWKINAKGEQHFPLDFGWLAKVERQAKDTGMDIGILVIHPKNSRRYVAVLDYDVLLSILAKIPQFGGNP